MLNVWKKSKRNDKIVKPIKKRNEKTNNKNIKKLSHNKETDSTHSRPIGVNNEQNASRDVSLSELVNPQVFQ